LAVAYQKIKFEHIYVLLKSMDLLSFEHCCNVV
jgi:hypothetical protein